MKKFSRVTALILAFALGTTALTACSKEEKSDETTNNAQTTAAESQEATVAEAWKPSTSINIRVPFKAGGSADLITRIAAQGMEKTYGKSVIVNNLTGANGAIAANDLLSMNAEPTEMMVAGITLFTLAPLFNPDIKVNLDDFEIIGSLIAEDFVLLTCPEKSGISTFEDLMEYGKTNRVVCAGNPAGGTTNMLATALFGQAGIDNDVLAHDGGAEDVLSCASGDAVACIVSATAATQYVDDGSLVPVACFSDEEFTGYDGFTVPTVKSKGYDIVFKSCNFLMAKKGVDKAVATQIYNDMLAYRDTDEFKELAANASYVPDNEDGDSVRNTIEAAAKLCQDMYDQYYAK